MKLYRKGSAYLIQHWLCAVRKDGGYYMTFRLGPLFWTFYRSKRRPRYHNLAALSVLMLIPSIAVFSAVYFMAGLIYVFYFTCGVFIDTFGDPEWHRVTSGVIWFILGVYGLFKIIF